MKLPMKFKSEGDLEDYCTDDDYDDDDHIKMCFGIVIKEDSDNIKLKIRFNATDTDPDN